MLLTLLIFLLLSNAVTKRQDKSILFSRVVIMSLLFIAFISWNNLYIAPLEKGIGLYGGLFHVTTFTQSFNIFIILVSALILTLNGFYPRKIYMSSFSSFYNITNFRAVYNKNMICNSTGQQFRIIEYPLIIVFIISGALFLISTNDLVSIFLSIELQSYGLYILSTLYRDSESATASGLTYFLLGGLSSCFILLGSGLLYVNSGTTSIENIYVITSLSEITTYATWYQPNYLHLSLIIMSVGFLFKVSAAPFHFWSPDVYDGIPTIVTTYVAIVAKISIFAFFLELVYYTEHAIFEFSWKNILLISSLLSLIIGSVLGLTQFKIKRLYAYSTINHVGFILLALSISSTESIQSYIFYILQYTLANLNAFIILISIGFSLYTFVHSPSLAHAKQEGKGKEESSNYKTKPGNDIITTVDIDEINSPIQRINQIKGYFKINAFISISLGVTLFSFAGIPPMIGFFGKQMILSAALDSGYVFMALVAILASVISAAYYLNIIKEMFFYNSEYIENPSITKIKTYIVPSKVLSLTSYSIPVQSKSNKSTKINAIANNKLKEEEAGTKNVILNSSLSIIISILTLLLVLFICIPEEWLNLVSILAIILFKS